MKFQRERERERERHAKEGNRESVCERVKER